MQYTSELKRLVLPEYGRNVQQMVDHCMTIEDRAERTRCANTIINIMGNLFPHLRDIEDFKHKLWDHLAIMSDFKLDIDYDCTPGVSSFLGAASALGVEYTVPEISQSVIITRMEGRTPVPSKESIESYAQHQTSMAIFLSVHDIEKVVERLHTGGYPMDTPIAVVYKATWEDEKIVKGTLEDIAQKVRENNIRKTALILVGRFLGKEYKNSKLYDKDFKHEYRG